jgi:hypothetical protein
MDILPQNSETRQSFSEMVTEIATRHFYLSIPRYDRGLLRGIVETMEKSTIETNMIWELFWLIAKVW